MSDLKELLRKVKDAHQPSKELDDRIIQVIAYPTGCVEKHNREWCIYTSYNAIQLWELRARWRHGRWPLTSSVDACVDFAKLVLPGWWFSIGTCSVSDDARICPDHNHPVHGERLLREFPPVNGCVFDVGIDVDRRPSGNLPLAFLEAILRAVIAIEEHKTKS